MKGWLDNFGKADNANESNVSLPEGFVGLGYNTEGRNYSPAWGGQFAMGGSLPGATGMMYTRYEQGGLIPIAQNGVSEYMKKRIQEEEDNSIAAQYNLPEVVVQGFRDASPFEQAGRMPQYNPLPTVPYLEKTKDPAEFFKSWITSPEYRRRKIETDYVEYPEYSPVTGDEIDDPHKGPLIDRAMRDNFLKLEQIQRPGAITYDPKRRSEYFEQGEVNVNPKDFAGDINTVKAHEIAHAIDTNEGQLSQKELDLLRSSTAGWAKKLPKNISPELWEKIQLAQHLEKPRELRADLNAIRFLMYDKDIYDIRKGEKFTKEHLERAKEKLKGNQSLERTLMVAGDENLINLMNIIAKKDEELTPIAMNGASMPGSVGFTYARVAGAAPSKGKYAKKTMASAQKGKQVQKGVDSTLENIFEIFDPTGVSSWDDVYQSYQKSGMSPETKFEIFGALPILGKVGKAGKLLGPALSAGQANKRLKTNAKLVSNVMQSIPYIGRGTDATQAVQQFSDVPFFPSAPPAEVGQFGMYAGMPVFNKKEYGGEIPSAQSGIMAPMLLARNVLNYFYPSEEATPTVSAAPVEYKKGLTDELLKRQAYKESTFNPAAVSPAGYKGLTQIGEEVLTDYSKKKGGKKLDPFNPKDAVELQKFAMDDLYNASFINKPDQPDSVRLAKTLAAYNWGRGNLFNYLNEQKQKGVDIYDSYDWLNDLPKETSDYVNKILLQEDQSFNKNYKRDSTNPKYKDITSLYGSKEFGGDIPFAQNGQEMRFYQNGLDWKPKSMQDGGVQRISTSDPRYPELYKNRQVGAYYDGAYSLPDLDEVTVTAPTSYTMDSLRDFTTAALYGAPANAMKLSMIPQAAMTEGIEALRGEPYDFSNVNPNFRGFTSNQRDLSQTMGYENPEGFLQNAANIGLSMIDPAILIGGKGALRQPLKQGLKKVDIEKVVPEKIVFDLMDESIDPFEQVLKNIKIDNTPSPFAKDVRREAFKYQQLASDPRYLERVRNIDRDFGSKLEPLLNEFKNDEIENVNQYFPFNISIADEIPHSYGGEQVDVLGISSLNTKGSLKNSMNKGVKYPQKITPSTDRYIEINEPRHLRENTPARGTVHHELKHHWTNALLDSENKNYEQALKNLVARRSEIGIDPRDVAANQDYNYLSRGTEVDAHLMTNLRDEMVNRGYLNDHFDELSEGKLNDFLSKEKDYRAIEEYFNPLKPMVTDKSKFVDFFNKYGLPSTVIGGVLGGQAIDKQKNGGITKDNLGYWNPDNWGQPVEIDSNDITMEGVYEPLLGVSDTGDTKLMKPGKNYKFKGKKVTEFPVAKLGINQLDAQPMKKLNQLLNFTNNPDKDNWLDKYN